MTEIVKGRSEKQARELLNSFFKMIKEGQEIKKAGLTEDEHIKFSSFYEGSDNSDDLPLLQCHLHQKLLMHHGHEHP